MKHIHEFICTCGLKSGVVLHDIQVKILELMKKTDINELSLRKIGARIGVKYPQRVKHHLLQLAEKGVINLVYGKYKL